MNMFPLNLTCFSQIVSITYDLYFCSQLQLLYYHNTPLYENVEHFLFFFSFTKHHLVFTNGFKTNYI